MSTKDPSGPRSFALAGPFSSGKTTLLENMLFAAGAISRKGSVKEGNLVSDSSTEARARRMSVEVGAARFVHMDETLTALDCPGSLEFLQETLDAAVGVDAVVLVAEAAADRAVAAAPLLNFLDARKIPTLLFINKLDRAAAPISDTLAALRDQSDRPIIARQVPILDGETIGGYVDLVRERAYSYRGDAASQVVEAPDSMAAELEAARTGMLESLADFDDALLEALLEDEVPPNADVFATLRREFQQGLVIPAMMGAGERQNGVRRLLKTLRHDLPEAARTAARAGIEDGAGAVAQVLKTYNTASSGKLSLARVWSGVLKDGASVNGRRVGSVNTLFGQAASKVGEAAAGEIVALGRLEGARTGDLLATDGAPPEKPGAIDAPILKPVYACGIHAEKRDDEVKMSDALGKLLEEDRSLIAEQNADVGQFQLRGQGEMHIRVALDRLRNKFKLPLVTDPPKIPYKETIRKRVERIQGRHKKQTGGHGQFGDVFLTVEPRPRGAGFEFRDSIVGGVVPKQYIPAVENGVLRYCQKGPLGFPVVDISVDLVFGSYHSVDSSEMAFQMAGRIAMGAAMPQCRPVLLEPIYNVAVHVPSEFTAQIQRLLSGRRGQILGFEAREGWKGWDRVSALLPQAEMSDLIIELRSLTRGVGAFDYRFENLQELAGKLADDVVAKAARADG